MEIDDLNKNSDIEENDFEPAQPMAEATNNDIISAIKALDSKIDSKIINDEWKNQKYDEMHNRMISYQDDAFGKIINPVLKDFIQLSDSIEKDIRHYEQSDQDNAEIVDMLSSIIERIDSIIYSYDIEEYIADSKTVNPKEQRIAKVIETDDPELNNVVSEVVQKGYILKDKIFRQQKVIIYKYKESK